jgi:hypothetical protein
MCKTTLPTLFAIFVSSVAMADVVRHDSLPNSYWGTWMRAGSDRSAIDLSAKTYANDDANCAVIWVSETAGANGPIYSAHLQCSPRSEKPGEGFLSNLIIWPKSADEIAVGHSFKRLKIFRRCRPAHLPPISVSHSAVVFPDAAQTDPKGECRPT